MGLLDNVLSTIDAKKRSVKRGLMDMLDNPSQWAGMQANRIQEDRYGGAENAQAMKQYLSKQPYDPKALTAANDALRNAAINESLGAVTAWHGSPHKFDKFDMSKIGTGEGAQAYGHGLYMAEAPEVAKSYADDLTKMRVQAAQSQLNKYGGNVDDAIDASRKEIDRLKSLNLTPATGAAKRDSLIAGQEEKLAELMAYKNQGSMNQGQMYKVDIPDEAVAKFLDWDKPLSQQAPEVQTALQNIKGKFPVSREGWDIKPFIDADPLFSTVHNAAMKELDIPGDFFQREFSTQGIPGIRYLDGGSRGAGAGTSNYVLFDDRLPRILETNGKPTGLQPWAKGEWKGLLDDAPQRPLTEFEQRHLTAQRNAALPVEQGGLGLPPSNTAMDRAKAMGFNQEAYHTSRTGVDTNVLDSGKYAIAPFDAIGTHFGTKEAAFDRFNRTVGTTEQIKGSSYPVLIKNDRQLLNDSADYYKEEPLGLMLSAQSDYGNLPKSNAALREKYFNSYDVIPYVNDVESAGSVSYIAPPANIRSRFAAFDPMRRHEADLLGYADPRLLGAMAGGGLLGLGGYSLMGDQ